MADLKLRGVSKRFGSVTAVAEVDLDVAHREFVVVVGPSGCGKSTLLRVIAGLEELTTGEIHLGGEAIHRTPPAKRGIAMVFQNYALYPHKSVARNMGFALRMAKVPPPEIERRVGEAARILRIEDLLDRKPRQLSGGQRQRVAIGRAIVREPKVFLFDEPLSNLDAALRVDMRVELARLHGSIDATMVYVTHDQTEAMTMADKIVVLRAGRIEQIGSPLTIYHHPANTFVAGFIGSPRMNLLPATVRAVTDATVSVDGPGGLALAVPVASAGAAARIAVGDPVTLGVRPEDLADRRRPGRSDHRPRRLRGRAARRGDHPLRPRRRVPDPRRQGAGERPGTQPAARAGARHAGTLPSLRPERSRPRASARRRRPGRAGAGISHGADPMKLVFVLFDSLNRRSLEPYGAKTIRTPAFRRLAERCVTFDTHYVGSLPCMPARRDMQTGRLNFLHRSWGPLEPFDNSFPELLHGEGVYSHLVSDHYHYWEDGGSHLPQPLRHLRVHTRSGA